MKATLTVDQGNSYAKATLFAGGRVEARLRSSSLQIEEIAALASEAGTGLDGAVYSTVGHFDTRLVESLRQITDGPVMALTHSTPLPIRIAYATPGTLGLDRIAAAAGAASMFPGETLLVADSGTALTLDVVDSDGTFLGGNIAPGIKLRLKSLYEYTDRLPEVPKHGDTPQFGFDTPTAIRSGAVRGTAADIADSYRRAARLFGAGRIVLTGGDAAALMPVLEESLEGCGTATLVRDLVAIGLNRILHYNEDI